MPGREGQFSQDIVVQFPAEIFPLAIFLRDCIHMPKNFPTVIACRILKVLFRICRAEISPLLN